MIAAAISGKETLLMGSCPVGERRLVPSYVECRAAMVGIQCEELTMELSRRWEVHCGEIWKSERSDIAAWGVVAKP
jgi:hypothetical protein